MTRQSQLCLSRTNSAATEHKNTVIDNAFTLQAAGMEFSRTYSIILLSEYEDVLFC
jgi:hypothetical protein